ncbi:MAG: hypothetical protein IKJ36_02585 [Clostridia bacterium]|nr:hypothetical protein [Clostridia bacterium]
MKKSNKKFFIILIFGIIVSIIDTYISIYNGEGITLKVVGIILFYLFELYNCKMNKEIKFGAYIYILVTSFNLFDIINNITTSLEYLYNQMFLNIIMFLFIGIEIYGIYAIYLMNIKRKYNKIINGQIYIILFIMIDFIYYCFVNHIIMLNLYFDAFLFLLKNIMLYAFFGVYSNRLKEN